jgi:hypothetical protein
MHALHEQQMAFAAALGGNTAGLAAMAKPRSRLSTTVAAAL